MIDPKQWRAVRRFELAKAWDNIPTAELEAIIRVCDCIRTGTLPSGPDLIIFWKYSELYPRKDSRGDKFIGLVNNGN